MFAVAGVSHRVRQAHMRHTAPRLATHTYTDETRLPITSEVALRQMASIFSTLWVTHENLTACKQAVPPEKVKINHASGSSPGDS